MFILLFSLSLNASGIVVKQSGCSVEETAHNLKQILKKKGITIFATINHGANARLVGLKMRPSIAIVFGKPKMGTVLMKEDPSIGVDLPLKVLIYQDRDGKTKIAYKDGSYYEEHYHIVKHKKLLHKISTVLNNLTNKAGQCKRD